MKTKIIGVIAACALSPLAHANLAINTQSSFIGIEAIQTNQDYETGFGKKVFTKNVQNYGVYGGLKFHKHFGVEVGYEIQPNRKKQPLLTGGDYIPGSTTAVPAGGSRLLESSIQTRHTYFGLFGEKMCHLAQHQAITFQGMLGLSASHVKARFALLKVNGSQVTVANYLASISTFSKTKVVPMVKVSAIYMPMHKVGIRLSAAYRATSKIKSESKEGGTPEIRFKDTFSLGLGASYYFM